MKKVLFLLPILVILSGVTALAEKFTEKVVPQSTEQLTLSYAPIVKKAAPAVVNIYTRKKIKVNAISPLMNDPVFRQFFGDRIPGGMAERVVSSLGSGVIVNSDGLIITNNHVVQDSDEITVVLPDRREFESEVVLSDAKTDLALVKIKTRVTGLPYLELGDSDKLEVGDVVLAIGNPFGVGQTVTHGIISALARTTVGISDFQFFIQTDAAINPGNSGGALVDMEGKLIGVNTAIYSKTGGSNGIGFAIPSNMAATVVASVGAKGGKVVRPWIGLTVQPVTAEIAESLGLSHPSGVMVKKVLSGGPAEKAGIKSGDVILQVDEKEIPDEQTLRFRVATYKVGSNADFKIFRDHAEQVIKVNMEAPLETPAAEHIKMTGKNPLSGSVVATITPALIEDKGLKENAEGVVVLAIAQGSIASRVGFTEGDIITTVNGQHITEVADLKAALGKSEHGTWLVVVQRGEETLNITIKG